MGEEMAQSTWSHFPELPFSIICRWLILFCSLGTGNPLGAAILKEGPLALLELLPLRKSAAANGRLLTTLVMGLLKF